MKKIGIIIFSFLMFLIILLGNFGSEKEEIFIDGAGGEDIVEVALSEVGTVGGSKYSLWYTGNTSGSGAWCARFVSWCANKCGFIESKIIPKFALCDDGITWFKKENLWQDSLCNGKRIYKPRPGDIIFFDYEPNGTANHVGIVKRYNEKKRKVLTIEGNMSNSVLEFSYDLGDHRILGYGTPKYSNTKSSDSNSKKAWSFFISKGYSKHATAGILGNLQQESGMDPTKKQNGGPAQGIAQWEGGRLTNLKKYAKKKGKKWTNLQTQLEFIDKELNGADPTTKQTLDRKYGGLSAFKRLTNYNTAVYQFEQAFERAGVPNNANRTKYAKKFYELYGKD